MTTAFEPVNVPHLALPLVLGPDGSFNTLQQGTVEEVAQCVAIVLGTLKGDRIMVPDFGVVDPTFSQPSTNEITQAISQWEPRAAPTVTVSIDESGTAQVGVSVSLASST